MGGTPFTLRCPKCRRNDSSYEHYGIPKDSHKDIVPTGKVKERVRRPGVGSGKKAQVKHLKCGYVWWTFHPSVTGNAAIRLGPGA